MSHGHDPGPRRIVLVGFMAAGKTTVGAELAARLGWELVDFDSIVAARTGGSAGALIRAQGVAALRAMEEEITGDVADRDRVILAPGGGWATTPGLAQRLGPGTLQVWLRVSAAEAVRRAAADAVDRPLLEVTTDRRGGSELDHAASLLREREPWYAAADMVVDVDGKAPGTVAEEILGRLGITREDDEQEEEPDHR